jgi:DNA-binding NtrC family response regulator
MLSYGGRRRILVVDDETSIADTLALILSTRGYELRVAYSAEAAIEILSEWSPDLAIMDVMLPQMNGIDLAIVIKANYPGCRIILFSGQPDTSKLLDEALKKGHRFDILAKPIHPGFILDTVSDMFSAGQEPLADA